MPVFTASTPMSSTTARDLRADRLDAAAPRRPETPSEFCAVTAVSARHPVHAERQHRLQVGLDARRRRPESEPATVSTRGGSHVARAYAAAQPRKWSQPPLHDGCPSTRTSGRPVGDPRRPRHPRRQLLDEPRRHRAGQRVVLAAGPELVVARRPAVPSRAAARVEVRGRCRRRDATRDVPEVGREPVADVDHRRSPRAAPAPARARTAAPAGGARRRATPARSPASQQPQPGRGPAEPAGDDDDVARAARRSAAPGGSPCRSPERGHRQHQLRRRGRRRRRRPAPARPAPPRAARRRARRPPRAAARPARTSPTSSAVGRAPIAATSARFCGRGLAPDVARRWTSRAGSAGPRRAGRSSRPPGRRERARPPRRRPGPSGGCGAGQPRGDARDQRELTRLADGGNGILLGAVTPRSPARQRPAERAHGRRAVVQAYILIQTEVGKAAEVAAALAELPGVTHAEDVTGPYDVIVRAEAADMDELTSWSSRGCSRCPGSPAPSPARWCTSETRAAIARPPRSRRRVAVLAVRAAARPVGPGRRRARARRRRTLQRLHRSCTAALPKTVGDQLEKRDVEPDEPAARRLGQAGRGPALRGRHARDATDPAPTSTSSTASAGSATPAPTTSSTRRSPATPRVVAGRSRRTQQQQLRDPRRPRRRRRRRTPPGRTSRADRPSAAAVSADRCPARSASSTSRRDQLRVVDPGRRPHPRDTSTPA